MKVVIVSISHGSEGREEKEEKTGWGMAWERSATPKACLALLMLFGFSRCWS